MNAVRTETIDYIFSNKKVIERSEGILEGLHSLPDEQNPSDHICVIAKLDLS